MTPLDLEGRKFNLWTALRRGSRAGSNEAYWNCRCDCGTRGVVKAQHLVTGRSKSCGCLHRAGNHPNNQGGSLNTLGYVQVYVTEGVTRLQHRMVMESLLGRALLPGETVHHKNGIRNDNRPKNLELWASSHPPGQRVSDLVSWAEELLRLYSPGKLA